MTPTEIVEPLKRPHAKKAYVTRTYSPADLNRDLYEVQHTATRPSTPGTRVGGMRKKMGTLMASQSTPTR